MKPFISLLTDFGPGSHFVGEMKSVIKKVNPEASIIDLCHDISPFNVLHAAYVLSSAVLYSPIPTIFVAVVDPGVGSERKPLLAVGENHYYVVPDNGILTQVLSSDSINQVLLLEEEHYMLPRTSETFHGRDVFAPVAAWLSKNHNASMFGDPIEDYLVLDIPKAKIVKDGVLSGTILFSDRFGNLASNITREEIEAYSEQFQNQPEKICVGNTEIQGLKRFYQEATRKGEPLALLGSMGLLEIAVRESNARSTLSIKPGDEIQVIWRKPNL